MSTSSLMFAGKQLTIYGGIIVFIAGVTGGLLNTIVFLSLRTFRQSSCAFYLTIMSIVNIGQLLTGLSPRILLYIYSTDGTDTSLFYCKFRFYFSHICAMTSLTCFCLATIDQYYATCSRQRLQQLCNVKLAYRLVVIFMFIWILHGIPQAVLYYHSVSSVTGKVSCTMTNIIYTQYRTYFLVLTLLGFIPFSITVTFGLMAYRNFQQLAHYTIPLVRRELDKQLTIMVLVQVAVNFFTLMPYAISNTILMNTNINLDPVVQAQIQLSYNITIIGYYVYYASSFYIYICVSKRFRGQFIYVLFKNHLNQWRGRQRPRMAINQVLPQP